MRKIVAIVAVLFAMIGNADAQSGPGWSYGFVPTAAQWNAAFAGKQDYLGAPPLLTIGGTMTGELVTAASTTFGAGFNLPQGAAPSSPANGDFWITSAGVFARVNGSTQTLGGVCANCAVTDATNIFTAAQEINLNSGPLQAALTGTLLQVGNADSVDARIEADAYAAVGRFSGVRADGTAASPTALLSADEIAGINAYGYDGTAFVGPYAGWRCYAAQNWQHSPAHYGTYCDVATTADNGSTYSEAVRFENDGGVTAPSTVTGGDKGAGTINAAGLYQAGVQVAAYNATLTLGSTALTLGGTVTTVAGLTLTSPTLNSPTVGTAMTLGWITGSVQCLHVNTSGQVSGTGSDCGSGGGGGTPGGSNTQVQYNNSSVFGGISGATSNGTALTVASGDLILSGSGSGSSTLNAPATGGGTSTLPAGSGTLVYTTVATLSSLTSVGTIGTGVWQGTAVAAGYGGTGISTASSTGVPQIASGVWSVSTTLPSGLTAPSLTVTSAFTATGLVTNGDLANSTITLGSTAMSLGSSYTTVAGSLTLSGTVTLSGTANVTGTFEVGGYAGTFPSAAFTVASLNLTDQTLTGGANVTDYSLGTVSSGTETIDCGKNPHQYLTNGGAFTLAVPANSSDCIVQVTNNGSAGAITFSGFTVNSSYTGATPDTTNGHIFNVYITRLNGSTTYFVVPLQ